MITLDKALLMCKPSWYVKIIVNKKFYLFGCIKKVMSDNKDYDYIKGFEGVMVDYIKKDYSVRGNHTFKIYITSFELEKRSLSLENMWYDENDKYLRGLKHAFM